jgi:hypothetical protein
MTSQIQLLSIQPYVGLIFRCISRVLRNIKFVDLPSRKVYSFLYTVRDILELRILGVHSICCECGQMGHSINIILKKHHQHTQLEHLDMSAMAEHSINLGHHIQLYNTSVIREVTGIVLNPNHMSRKDGFCLSKSWKPLIYLLKCQKKPSLQDSLVGFSRRPHRSMNTALTKALIAPFLGTHQH